MSPISPALVAFLKNLTSEPGVYRMLDDKAQVLYVGKAKNLKKRVGSYFNKNHHNAKTKALVQQIVAIEISVTRSETEAFLLESSFIKSLRPKYNILMRDDKSYPYLYVSGHPSFPRIEVLRAKKKPKTGLFYGPYPSTAAVQQTLLLIQKIFKIRNCRDAYFNARSRPCLQYQIKRCTAPCVGYISAEDYQRSVANAIQLLQGKSQVLMDELEQRMDAAVQRLAFEEAAWLRDQIKNLRLIQEQQGVMRVRGEVDVIAIEARLGFACVQCVTVRDGQIMANQSFFPSVPVVGFDADLQENGLWNQVFHAFIGHYYAESPERVPKLIITNAPVQEQPSIEAWLTQLRKKNCQIQSNPRGSNAQWLAFACNNLRLASAKQSASEQLLHARYQALATYLQLEKSTLRLECFDISHTQGQQTIASCVVFDEQGPCYAAYRRFNISGITPGDDYAAMRQAIERHFKRSLQNHTLPDVLVIDGGKGQVAMAEQVLTALGITQVVILGIAKGPSRKAGWERIMLTHSEQEKILESDSPARHLLQHIRDEAHRFAITGHRKKRQKASFDSSLDTIEGIGAKRKQALLKRFGGLRELANAPIHEIAKVSGISLALATKVYHHFHPENL